MQHHEEAWIYNGQEKVPRTVRRVKIADTVVEIPDNAFQDHRHLEEVTLSSSVQVIGKWAFCWCRELKSILFQGQEKEEVGIPSNVKVIEDGAFLYCTSLARLVLNEGLEQIGEEAFYDCFSLSRIRIPRSVDRIAASAFSSCTCLVSIELPEESSFKIELSGCSALVSVAGPMSTFLVEREELFQDSKLGSLVDNEADLTHRLKHRFDDSPLNKLCYYQSYQSLDVAMGELRCLMEDDPLAATTQVDGFGMTPLHVLSLSQTPNLDMLLAVIDAGKAGHMVRTRDSFGCTPMVYLCLNRMPNSSEVIRRLFQTRFEQVLGLGQSWKSEMLQVIDEALAGDMKSEIFKLIRKYERKEILSLVEIFLWKMKIDEATSNKKVKIGADTSKEEQILFNRQRCRAMSGAAVVIPHVLPFF
eukprot:scaffold7106_cov121-Cylindrotheca_fusiformis.AAC.5